MLVDRAHDEPLAFQEAKGNRLLLQRWIFDALSESQESRIHPSPDDLTPSDQ